MKQLLAVVLGKRDGDAVVVVLHQLLSQKDERLSWRKNRNMLEVKDVGKLLDEVAGCCLLADDDEIVDVVKVLRSCCLPKRICRS